MTRYYTFWFHYNKQNSTKAGKPQLTIHYKKQCLIVDNVDCNVNIKGHLNKQQPFFVLKGKCSTIEIINNIAFIK